MSEDPVQLVEGSKLTKQWLAEVMETNFDEQPTVNEVVPLGPEALGYMSTMRRVHLQWANPQDKPSSVIIKLPNVSVAAETWNKSSENGHEMDEYGDEVIKMMHNCETNVYNCLSKYPEFRLSIPFLYAALDIDSGTPIIVMEDLEKTVVYDVVDGFNEKQLYAIVDELVKLHALSFKYREVAECGIKKGSPKMMEQFENLIRGVAEQLVKQYPEYLASVEVLIRNYLSTHWFDELYQDSIQDPNTVLCHGDLWSPQILWKGEKIAGIVDWALCKKGAVTIDLMHVMSMCVPVRLREEISEKLYDYYVDELSTKMESIGLESPINKEIFEQSYKRMLPYTAAMGVFAAGMWSNSPVLKKGGDDDSRRVQEIMQRCKAIVDETVLAYQWK